jgi:hypothetical protein
MPPVGKLAPSQAVREMKRKSFGRKTAGLALGCMSLFLMLSGMGLGFFVLIPAGILFFGEQSGRGEIVRRKAQAERDWQEAQAVWEKTAGAKRFDEKLAAIRRCDEAIGRRDDRGRYLIVAGRVTAGGRRYGGDLRQLRIWIGLAVLSTAIGRSGVL